MVKRVSGELGSLSSMPALVLHSTTGFHGPGTAPYLEHHGLPIISFLLWSWPPSTHWCSMAIFLHSSLIYYGPGFLHDTQMAWSLSFTLLIGHTFHNYWLWPFTSTHTNASWPTFLNSSYWPHFAWTLTMAIALYLTLKNHWQRPTLMSNTHKSHWSWPFSIMQPPWSHSFSSHRPHSPQPTWP